MNLFDNIIQTSKNNFLGTKPIVPSTPIFTTPQAPRTSSYIAPNTPYTPSKPSMSLFSDEKQMFQKMKADNLSDDTAYSMLKKRRMDILGGNDLANDEKSMLLKMQADNVPVKEAVSLIQKRRADQFNKKYKEGNLLQKGAYNTLAFAAGNLETLAKYSGNTLDFITGGTMGFGDEVNKMEQVTSSPEFSESSAFTAGTYLPDVALAVSPLGGQYLAGAKGMTGLQGANLFSKIGAKNLTQGLMGRSAVVGAGFGATQPIFDQGSDATMEDIATGAAVGGALGAVSTPVFGKTLKYGQAGYYGGFTGMGKSITRDIKSGVNAITPSGANISTKANRFNASEIRNFIKTTGETPGQFATSRGMTKVGDDAVVEATNLWQKSKDQADEALKAIKGRFRFTDEGEDLLKTTLDDLETRLVNTKSPDYKRISQLKAKYEDTGLTMSEINEIKRAYSNNYKYSFVDAGSESALRSKNLQDAVRKWQFKVAEENGLTNLKEINKTTQGWKMFADSLSKKIQGSSGNNNVSLTDWIALSGGSPENIALYLGKKLASSDTVKSGAIKLFSKKTKPSIIQASKADIQQANFLKDVNRGVSGVGDNSGGKSMVRPVGLLPAPTGKSTGAKNFRVNQPIEKSPIKNEGQVGVRPGSKPTVKPNTIKNESKVNKPVSSDTIPEVTPKVIGLTDETANAYKGKTGGGIKNVEPGKQVKYNQGDSYEPVRMALTQKDADIARYGALSKKQMKTSVTENEKLEMAGIKGRLKMSNAQLETRAQELRDIAKLARSNKESVLVDLRNGELPEGYFKNAFGEIQKNPSNKKGGFIKIPEIGKKVEPIDGIPVGESLNKYKNVSEFADDYQGNLQQRILRVSNNENYITELEKSSPNTYKKLIEVNPELKNDSLYVYKAAKTGENIVPGDWIALNEGYAKAHQGGVRTDIFKIKVPKSDISWAGTDANEFFYTPSKMKGMTLEDFYNKATKPKSIVKNPLVEEARKIGVDINKYFENVSEKSAMKMADYASDIVGKKMVKGERPMDMSELGMLSNKINKNEAGGNITTVGDILKDSELRKLYEKSLDTPITILDERVAKKGQLGGYVPMGEGRYGGHIVLFGGNKEISNNLPKSLLHEAAHSIRDSKGRKLAQDYRISPIK